MPGSILTDSSGRGGRVEPSAASSPIDPAPRKSVTKTKPLAVPGQEDRAGGRLAVDFSIDGGTPPAGAASSACIDRRRATAAGGRRPARSLPSPRRSGQERLPRPAGGRGPLRGRPSGRAGLGDDPAADAVGVRPREPARVRCRPVGSTRRARFPLPTVRRSSSPPSVQSNRSGCPSPSRSAQATAQAAAERRPAPNASGLNSSRPSPWLCSRAGLPSPSRPTTSGQPSRSRSTAVACRSGRPVGRARPRSPPGPRRSARNAGGPSARARNRSGPLAVRGDEHQPAVPAVPCPVGPGRGRPAEPEEAVVLQQDRVGPVGQDENVGVAVAVQVGDHDGHGGARRRRPSASASFGRNLRRQRRRELRRRARAGPRPTFFEQRAGRRRSAVPAREPAAAVRRVGVPAEDQVQVAVLVEVGPAAHRGRRP